MKNIDYQEILRDFSFNLLRLKQPKRLLTLITRFIDREIALTHTSILIFEENKNHYTFLHSKGSRRFPAGFLKIEQNHPFVEWFETMVKSGSPKNYYLSRDLVQNVLKEDTQNGRHAIYEKIQTAMKVFEAELIVPAYDAGRLIALLILGKKKNGEAFSQSEINFFQTLAHACSIALKTSHYHRTVSAQNTELQSKIQEVESLRKKERETYHQILKSLAQEVHARDPYTYGHINQVEKLGVMTAKEMGMDLSDRRKDILSASLILHDIGKIGIPDHILLKPAKLDAEEWEIMKTHVDKGVRILNHLELFREVAEIIHCHHERPDGKGYPRGLKGDEIPVEAKIISVVDAYHAIVSKRCYDAARPIQEAFRELTQASGTQFDGEVVQAFIRAQHRVLAKRRANACDPEALLQT